MAVDEESLIWGRRAVIEALTSGVPVNRVYLATEARGPEVEAIKAAAKARQVRYDFVEVGKLGALAGTRDHQEVVARLSPVAYTPLDALLRDLTPSGPAVLLALDQVQHPGNAGMAVRAAAAAGAVGVLLPIRGGRLVNAEVIRASAGTVFRIPLVATAHLTRDLRALKDHGFWIYALEAGATQSLYTVDWPARCVLVVGNETRGLRPSIKQAADAAIGIPLAAGIESLNVAVAAGVALFEIRRRQS